MRKYSQYVDIEKVIAYLADSSYSGKCKVSLVEPAEICGQSRLPKAYHTLKQVK